MTTKHQETLEDIFTPDKVKEDRIIREQVVDILAAKNNLMNEIGLEELLNKIKAIISESSIFEFRSKSAEFIDPTLPIFIMRIPAELHETLYEVLPDTATESQVERRNEAYEEKVLDLVQEELILPTGTLLVDYMEENKEAFEEFDKEYGEDLRDLLLTNIFAVTIASPEENNIQLRIVR